MHSQKREQQMELYRRFRSEKREETGNCLLTSSQCGGCEVVLCCQSATQCCSHSDRVFSSLLQTSQCVNCPTTRDICDVIMTVNGTVSVGVGDGVVNDSHISSQ